MTSLGDCAGPEHAEFSTEPAKGAPPPGGPWRKAAACLIVAAGFSLVAAAYAMSLQGKNAAATDFIGYWVAGQQLAHHANPYDPVAAFVLEKAAGYDGSEARLTPSPPVALFLLAPFGYLGAKAGLFAWTMLQFMSLSLALRVLWQVNGRPSTMLHLFGFVFAPAIASLQAGQLGLFLLLAIVLFLYFVQTRRPFIAGAVLLPCALKPHLFLPLAITLILWTVFTRTYRVLFGTTAVALAGSALTMLFDPRVWTHFVEMTRSATLQDRFTPTLSVVLRVLVAWHAEWPRFVPLAIGCGWALWYFWTRRKRWDWMDQGLVVLLVSLLCSPYAWFTDESVLLPPLITASVRAKQGHRSLVPIILVAAIALVELLSGVKITTLFYVWTTPAWLACYLLATMRRKGDMQVEVQRSSAQIAAAVDR